MLPPFAIAHEEHGWSRKWAILGLRESDHFYEFMFESNYNVDNIGPDSIYFLCFRIRSELLRMWKLYRNTGTKFFLEIFKLAILGLFVVFSIKQQYIYNQLGKNYP